MAGKVLDFTHSYSHDESTCAHIHTLFPPFPFFIRAPFLRAHQIKIRYLNETSVSIGAHCKGKCFSEVIRREREVHPGLVHGSLGQAIVTPNRDPTPNVAAMARPPPTITRIEALMMGAPTMWGIPTNTQGSCPRHTPCPSDRRTTKICAQCAKGAQGACDDDDHDKHTVELGKRCAEPKCQDRY